jgi:hypothetical protein
MRQRGGEGFGGVEPRSTPTGRVAPLLADVIYEGTERAIDEAMQVLLDGLSRPDKTQRLAAAAYLLRHTEVGRVAAGEGVGRRVAKPQSLRPSR